MLIDLLNDLGRLAARGIAAATAGLDGLTDLLPAEVDLIRSKGPQFGDFQISACLQLAKRLGDAAGTKVEPRKLAAGAAAALADHPALTKVEVAGPGFVNLHLRDTVLAELLDRTAQDAALGLRPVGAGQRVVIDYSSPNVAKPMHIGHIRSTIIGACLDKVLRALGYDVIADNHIGDWGTQFGKLIVAFRRWADREAYDRDAIAELERIYQLFGREEAAQLAALGEAAPAPAEGQEPGGEPEAAVEPDAGAARVVAPILEEARRELVKLQAGDPENTALWKDFIARSRETFERIYRRLDVRFDYWLGESGYNQMLPLVVEELVRRGIAVEDQGALVVKFEAENLSPYIVRKGDGAFNYATTDLAGIALRTGLFRADRIVIVTDERQQLHFQQLFATARRLGVTTPLEHVWFGLMRFWNEETKQYEAGSTRKGNVIYLADLLDEAERRAAVLAAEHSGEVPAAERAEIARVVGLGAVKYNDLSKDRQTLISFSWDKALAMSGNTAPYLQYAYARCRSIIAKAGIAKAGIAKAGIAETDIASALDPDAPLVLETPAERALALHLLGYPAVVELVGRTLRPHLMAEFLYGVADVYTTFYNACPVLNAEPAARASRLRLVDMASRTLKHGLGLMGIQVVERM